MSILCLLYYMYVQAFPPLSSGMLSHRKSSYSDQRPAWTVTVLQTLVPYIVMFVAVVDTVLSRITTSTPIVHSKW
jgi:TRAP-type mannitol/chloroaromatic compound transport system permease large subunit